MTVMGYGFAANPSCSFVKFELCDAVEGSQLDSQLAHGSTDFDDSGRPIAKS